MVLNCFEIRLDYRDLSNKLYAKNAKQIVRITNLVKLCVFAHNYKFNTQSGPFFIQV